MVTWQLERCQLRVPPCSTFKIVNSLIGLETGVVKGIDERFAWDGVSREVAEWNRDHTLATAFAVSAVPVYQQIARRIGAKRMQAYLDRLGYGNRDMSGGLDRFWLGSSLKVSPREQVDFLRRLCRNELPFAPHNLHLVRQIMLRETSARGRLHGKTGMVVDLETLKPLPGTLAWFVGYVVSRRDGRTYLFAANIAGGKASGGEARRIVTDVLRAAELM